MRELITDLEGWARVGRGKTFQFFATDEEVSRSLLEGLPEAFGPFSIIAIAVIRDGRGYSRESVVFGIEDFCEQRLQGQWDFFLRSHTITPEIELSAIDRIDRFLSLNGMINLQHGALHHDKLTASCIGIVDKIAQKSSSETIHHREYMRVFDSLKKSIKGRLSFTAVYHFADGRKRETKTATMSKKIVERYHAGEVLLEAEPGVNLR